MGPSPFGQNYSGVVVAVVIRREKWMKNRKKTWHPRGLQFQNPHRKPKPRMRKQRLAHLLKRRERKERRKVRKVEKENRYGPKPAVKKGGKRRKRKGEYQEYQSYC